MFPEGELSRDGRVGEPKLGFLSYICRACSQDRDIVFIPVGINYDRIPEDRRLAYAEGSFENPKASFLILSSLRYVATVLALPFRRRSHRFGYAGVSFDTPLSLQGWLEAHGIDVLDINGAGRNAWLPEFADALMEKCARRIPILPVPLAAKAIVEQPDRWGWTDYALEKAMTDLLQQVSDRDAHVYLPEGVQAAASFARDMLIHNGLMKRIDENVFAVNESERAMLRFYAGSIEHLLS
jgi:glycerol-3-phosphate O-acyltransferase